VDAIDLAAKTVSVSHGDEHHHHDLPFDRLVIALGSTTNFHGLPGLEARALTMKSLGDAIELRNRVIANMEEADFECCAALRRRLLTFVVAGGGFAGVETAAAINDFIHEALPFYPNLSADQVRVALVHSGAVILPELSAKLGAYAQKKLAARGVDVRLGRRVARMDDGAVVLDDGEALESCTLVWTAGTSANPLLRDLPCPKERGRLVVDEHLEVKGWPGVFALGDCAVVPDPRTGGAHPPTAQHALREGTIAAGNVLASIRRSPMRPFTFRTLGQLASLGRRTGVANVLGVNFSGFVAWWLWRSIYLSKLPRVEKKLRVALDWTLDLFFSKDLVQFQTLRSRHLSDDGAAETARPGAHGVPARVRGEPLPVAVARIPVRSER
jgi:NADH dehydrogenase